MKPLLIIIFSMWGICSAQKVRNVIAKDGETINVKIANGTSNKVQINGKVVYTQGVQIAPPPKVLYLKDFSDWRIAFNTAITDSVILQGETMEIQSDCIPEQQVPFDGDLILQGTLEKPLIITCNFRDGIDRDTWALYLGNGKKVFNNVIFRLGTQGAAKWGSTVAMGQQGTTFDVTFNNCKWEQGFRYCFNSTQGFGSVSFINCQLDSYFNNIQLYSQLGAKTLIMNHCTIRTDESHCVYASPWNNYYLNDVVCLGAGKRAFDSRADKIYPFKSTFQIFTNCKNAVGAVATDREYGGGVNAPQWHLWGEGTPSVIVDSCNLAAGSWQGNYTITNSNIYNSGGGTVIYDGSANLTNCTGEITAVGKMNISNSNMVVIAQDGADITATNSSVTFYNKFTPPLFKANFKNCNIGEFDIKATNFKVLFDNCNFRNQYGSIRLFGKVMQMDDIEFIGNSYPIATY